MISFLTILLRLVNNVKQSVILAIRTANIQMLRDPFTFFIWGVVRYGECMGLDKPGANVPIMVASNPTPIVKTKVKHN